MRGPNQTGSRGLSDCTCSPSGIATAGRAVTRIAWAALSATDAAGASVTHLFLRRGLARNEQREDQQRQAVALSRGHFTSSSGMTSLDSRSDFLSGMTSARGSGPKSSPNLIGGRSWNMKSHFQRSDGFDACSQCRADTGRAKSIDDSAA